MEALYGVKLGLNKKRPVDPQTTNMQQALRRLKYLHTSLASPSKPSLKPIKTTSSPPSDDFDFEKRCDFSSSKSDKRCFLALSPDSELKTFVEDRKRKQMPRRRVGFRPVCKGRPPLTRFQSNPTFRQVSTTRTTPWESQPRDATTCHGTSSVEVSCVNSTIHRERAAKSAPASGGISSLNPEEFDCIQCFVNVVERLQRKETDPTYSNNMKINRVTFSARPRPKETNSLRKNPRVAKITTEKSFNVPQTSYNGWGVRSRPNNARNIPRDTRKDIDVTEELQTLRITPRGVEDGTRNDESFHLPPPPAPPTPVRQIDIKMPEGLLIQHRLQTVA